MENIVNNFKLLGISGREAEVYIALLQKKELTAPEIAKITSVSRTKIYEILQNLVKKNICNENYKDGVKTFSCIEPKIALHNILSSYETEINSKKLLAEEIEDNLMSLYKKNKKNEDSLDYIEVISDKGQLRDRFIYMEKTCKKELLVFTKPPFAQALEENIEPQSKISKKIRVRCIYEYKEFLNKDEKNKFIKLVQAYQNLGEEARVIEELPMKLAMIDETMTMLSLPDRIPLKSGLTSIIINHPVFAKTFKLIFETYWDKSISLEEFKEKVI